MSISKETRETIKDSIKTKADALRLLENASNTGGGDVSKAITEIAQKYINEYIETKQQRRINESEYRQILRKSLNRKTRK